MKNLVHTFLQLSKIDAMVVCHDAQTARRVAMASNCPSTAWLDEAMRHPPLSTAEPFTFVNVGANKGYAVASMLQRVLGANLTNAFWRDEMVDYLRRKGKAAATSNRIHTPCGACKACREQPPRPLVPRRLRVHAFEMLEQNARWLRWAFGRFGVDGTVTCAVVGNQSGNALIQAPSWFGDDPARLGAEHFTAFAAGASRRGRRAIRTTDRQQVSLDDHLRQHGVEHVHLMSIDCEGYDALVLEGLRRTLTDRAVDFLEFEYHSNSYWAADAEGSRSLEQTLAWLQTLQYSCFFAGNAGCLAPASGPCWKPSLEIRKWSNLVCAWGNEHVGPQRHLWKRASQCASHVPQPTSRRLVGTSDGLPASLARVQRLIGADVLGVARNLFAGSFRVHLDTTCAVASGVRPPTAAGESWLDAWTSAGKTYDADWWQKYSAEALLPHMLAQSPFVTADWRVSNASLVLLPVWMQGGAVLAPERCRRLLEQRSEAFQATRGARHFFVLTEDRGPCCHQGDMAQVALLRHHVLGVHGEMAGHHWRHPLKWRMARRNAGPDLPCFDVVKDVSIPPPLISPRPLRAQSRAARNWPLQGAAARRELLAFYVGAGLSQTGLREGRRSLHELYGNDTDPGILVRRRASREQVAQGMARAKFCLIMGGYAPWTPRLIQAVEAGCVPVLCSSWLPPFSRVLDWSQASLRLERLTDLSRLRAILEAADYASLAAGVQLIGRSGALAYRHRESYTGSGVLPFVLLEMALAMHAASPPRPSLAQRADAVLSATSSSPPPTRLAPVLAKQLGVSAAEGLLSVSTARGRHTRTWQCAPLQTNGHVLHENPYLHLDRVFNGTGVRHCVCKQTAGPASTDSWWSTTQTRWGYVKQTNPQ